MKIGILVNTDNHKDHLIGITRAALERGHEVIIFIMDSGTRLLEDIDVTSLSSLQGVSMSFCDHNATGFNIDKSKIPESVVCGSQYNNAQMQHNADRVIVL